MNDKKGVGHRLRIRREAMGLSRRQLADRLGVDRSAVTAWESGRYVPRPERQTAVAAALKVGRASLFAPESEVGAESQDGPGAALIDTFEELPELLLDLTRRARLLRGFRLSAPYATAAYIQSEWRNLVGERLATGTLEVQRVEIVYSLQRLQEILSNVFRFDGCKYYVKSYCLGLQEVVPAFGGYMFDDDEFLVGAYWATVPPSRKPGLRLSSHPFTTYFNAYWAEVWSRGTLLNHRGKHDLSAIEQAAHALGLDPSRWPDFVEEARTLEIGDGAPPLF